MEGEIELPKDGPLPTGCDSPGCLDDGTLTIMHRHDGRFIAVLAQLSADVLTIVCGECMEPIERLRVTGTVRLSGDEAA